MGCGLIGSETIVGLGLIGTETTVSFWYYVRTQTNRWWNGGSSSSDPLMIGVDAVELASEERWCNDVFICWFWYISVVWIHVEVLRRGSLVLTQGRPSWGRFRISGFGRIEGESSGGLC